jgi:hypothetical protein
MKLVSITREIPHNFFNNKAQYVKDELILDIGCGFGWYES